MKTLFIPIIALLLTVNTYAQKPSKEKMKALKVAHITEQLDLTAKEAQAFWPIYNANEDKLEKLKTESVKRRKEKKPENLSEIEAKSLLLEMVSIEKQKCELDEQHLINLLKVLPAKKIIALHQANRSFRRKMIDEFKQRHRGEKNKKK